MTHFVGKNLLLICFLLFRQLEGRYCSNLLPRQDGGTFQINRRFSPTRWVTLYKDVFLGFDPDVYHPHSLLIFDS